MEFYNTDQNKNYQICGASGMDQICSQSNPNVRLFIEMFEVDVETAES